MPLRRFGLYYDSGFGINSKEDVENAFFYSLFLNRYIVTKYIIPGLIIRKPIVDLFVEGSDSFKIKFANRPFQNQHAAIQAEQIIWRGECQVVHHISAKFIVIDIKLYINVCSKFCRNVSSSTVHQP